MKNGVMMQYFEWNLPNDGSLWNKLKDDAKHLHEIGVTSVWIPPAYKADEQQDEGYAVYDLFDLGEFDQKDTVRTKYGTKDELKAAIAELHKYQIQVYLDTVMNHKCGGDYTETFPVIEVNPDNRKEAVSDLHDIQGWTGFNFKGRNNKYSDFNWHWYHFSGVDYDDMSRNTGIYMIQGEGKHWSKGVDDENVNYDFLLGNDLDLDHPEVVAELIKWGKWVSNELDLDGMRLDAIKHMKPGFIQKFLKEMREERGDKFYVVGEYWKGDFDTLDAYCAMMDNKIDLFDVPLHYKMFQACNEGRDFDFTSFPDDTLVSRHPGNAVTFVDNHDSQHGSSLESQIADWFKPIAYGLILLMEKGYPCIFYGDYYGIGGKESPHRLVLDILLDARRKYAYGQQDYYFDHPNTLGLVRRGDKKHPGSGLALLISNGEDGDKVMYVGKERAGEIWHEITGNVTDEVVIGENGKARFLVNGGKLAVWTKKD